MNRYFTKTFVKFFLGFLVIIIVAFGVVFAVGVWRTVHPNPVDNIALPR